jgi:hypothetical protein
MPDEYEERFHQHEAMNETTDAAPYTTWLVRLWERFTTAYLWPGQQRKRVRYEYLLFSSIYIFVVCYELSSAEVPEEEGISTVPQGIS